MLRWMADVDRRLRNLDTGNPLNRGAVQNAAGDYVRIDQIAFGAVAAENLGLLELSTPSEAPGGIGWVATGGPSVNVLVTGGKLRVDVAAALTAQGNKCSMYMSYALLGPGQTEATQTVQAVAPAYTRAVEVQHADAGMDQRLAAGTFGEHIDLVPGWYTVAARYAMLFSGTTGGPYGSAQNRRLLATPF